MNKLSILVAIILSMPIYIFAQKEIKEDVEFRTKGLSEVQVKRIETIMKPVRLQVEKIVSTDNPELFKQYKKDMEAFLKLKDTKAKKEAVHNLEDKYYKYFRACYTKANINEKPIRDSIAAIIPDDIPYTFGEFLAIRSTARKSAAIGPKSSADCPALVCPLDVNATRKYGTMAGWGDVLLKDCVINTFGMGGMLGSADFVGYIGQKAEFPAGTPDQIVTALVDMNMWIQAGASANGTYTESQIGVKIKGPACDKRYVDYSMWAVAPVIWFTYQTDNATQYEMSTAMRPDAKGGIYTLQVYARSFCVSGGAGITAIETLVPKVHAIRMCEKL